MSSLQSSNPSIFSKVSSILILSVILVINLAIWAWVNKPEQAPTWDGTIMGLSFNPFQSDQNPDKNIFPSPADIDRDLALLKDQTHAVRTYSITNGLELVPDMARDYGLNVTPGAWIGPDPEVNDAEIKNLIPFGASSRRNVVRLLVGNEAILREDVTVPQMIGYLRHVRKNVWRPVSTAEPWHVWLDNPELADEVDYIAAHILPYWEGIPVEDAVDYVIMRYKELQAAFPDKKVLIMEVGWPSSGPVIKGAEPSLANQATFLREFLNRAKQEDITYYVVEAFDQPWKMKRGSVEGYWGIYNVDREPKFDMKGEVMDLPAWKNWAVLAIMLALLPALLFLDHRKTVLLPGKLFFLTIANLAASAIAWTVSTGFNQYQNSVTASVWILLILMQGFALLILLIEGLDVSEILWQRKSDRRFSPLDPPADFSYPKVSLHLPIHNEPPEMVRQTLNALAKLDYPNFEVLVLDNNTTDPAIWEPVEKHCQWLSENFRFFHLENWPGFKAGALNYGLGQTSEDAEIVGVIDSDYIVEPDWLKRMVPYFDKPDVGFVQAPQDYRDHSESAFKSMCYWEYAGFFNIGMVQRNEFNAIIQHGTMTLVRKSSLKDVGAWGEWCICEDAELGLRLYKQGYDSVYVKHTFGRGVMPDTLSAYKSQRYRWVYGAMQIMKHYWRDLFRKSDGSLTPAQRYYFISGWLPWIADGLSMIFTFASILLSLIAITNPAATEFPVTALLLPVIGLFLFKVIRAFWLYAVKVKCSTLKTFGSAVAGLALSHTVARAVLAGLFTSHCPFLRTPKMEEGRILLSGLAMVREEIGIMILLWSCAATIGLNEVFANTSGRLWMTILLIQSIPYFSAIMTALINIGSNWNSNRKKPLEPATQLH